MGIVCRPLDNDITIWEAIIFGQDDTEWENGIFKLRIEFTSEYPTKPPLVKFLTKMFHPNIYQNGDICIDILQNAWVPSLTALSTLVSIQ